MPQGEEMRFPAPPSEVLAVMDRVNLRTMVNLTGGVGTGLEESIRRYQTAHPGRFLTFCEPHFARINAPNYAREQADAIDQAHRAGAAGLKVLKTLGLYLREQVTSGPLVKIDDRRFDPMCEACASNAMPVAIHISDPEAFFLPIDRFNERFRGAEQPSRLVVPRKDFHRFRDLLEARNRLFARHPKTTFVARMSATMPKTCRTFGVSRSLSEHEPGDWCACGRARAVSPRLAPFFERYQIASCSVRTRSRTARDPQQIFESALEIYFRFLETEDEYFDYAPPPCPAGALASTASGCPIPSCARCTTRMPPLLRLA